MRHLPLIKIDVQPGEMLTSVNSILSAKLDDLFLRNSHVRDVWPMRFGSGMSERLNVCLPVFVAENQ